MGPGDDPAEQPPAPAAHVVFPGISVSSDELRVLHASMRGTAGAVIEGIALLVAARTLDVLEDSASTIEQIRYAQGERRVMREIRDLAATVNFVYNEMVGIPNEATASDEDPDDDGAGYVSGS